MIKFLFLFIIQAHAVQKEISLKEAFISALEKTETVGIGTARVHQADARIDQAKARFYPNVALVAGTQKQDYVTQQTSSVLGGSTSYSRISLTQSLYEGGRDKATLEANRAAKEASLQNLSIDKYNLFSSVAQNFYGVLSNDREVENLKVTIKLAEDRVKEIKNRTQIGRSRNIELLAAEAQVSVLQAQLMAAQGQLVTSWDQFVLLTGLSRDVQLIKKREVPLPPKDLSTYIELLDKRPDIQSMKSQVEVARSTEDVMSAGHLPSLSVTGNYYITRDGPQKDNHWDVTGNLTFPIFSGGLVKAQVTEAKARIRESEFLLSQARRQAEISIRTSYNNLVAALNQVATLEAAMKTTEQNYKEQEKNYRFGQATNLDVIQALNSFQDTKRTLDRTRYLALSAWAQLRASTAQISLADVKGDL